MNFTHDYFLFEYQISYIIFFAATLTDVLNQLKNNSKH